ncbi:MAG: hypothetical protein KDB70_04025 [Mycobacterium sp.]|nr:hypothetical protein [Mycobacterium sp.]
MGILGTVARLAGRDPALEHRLYIASALQHQKRQIDAEYDAPREQQRAAEAAMKEARVEWEKREKAKRIELAEQEKLSWAQWAMTPRYTGGHAVDPLIVTHHRSGRVPVLILPPPAAVAAGDRPLTRGAEETIKGNPALLDDARFMERAKVADGLYSEVRRAYGPLLTRLRDPQWWQGLTTAAGVADKSTEPYLWQGQYASGKETLTTYDIPVIENIRVAPDGLRIRIAPRLGDTAKRWNAQRDGFRAAFKAAGGPAGDLSVHEDASGAIVIRLNDADPLADVGTVEHVYDPEKGRSLLGVTSTGQQAWITWRGSSGMVVGGVPGSGKTASLLPVFGAMKGECELHVFDGKSGFDMHPLRHIAATYDRTGDLAAPLETLRALDQLRVERAEALHQSIGANNFWNVDLVTRRRLGITPVFCILDECQTWLDQSGMDPSEKTIAAEVKRLIRTLVQKGRSAGIVMVLTTQKPDSTSIPTVIRDNAALKLAFKVSTPEQATTILGQQPSTAPSPTEIPMSAKGRAVMETEGQGIALLQSGYRDPDELDAELANEQPVEDQSVVAARLAGKGAMPAAEEEPETGQEPEPESPAPSSSSVAELADALSAAELAAIATLLAKMRGGAESASSAPEPVAEADEPDAGQAPPVMTKPTPAPKPPPAATVNDTPAF